MQHMMAFSSEAVAMMDEQQTTSNKNKNKSSSIPTTITTSTSPTSATVHIFLPMNRMESNGTTTTTSSGGGSGGSGSSDDSSPPTVTSSCSSATIALSHIIRDALLSGKEYPGTFAPTVAAVKEDDAASSNCNGDEKKKNGAATTATDVVDVDEALRVDLEELNCYDEEDWDDVDIYEDVRHKILTADLLAIKGEAREAEDNFNAMTPLERNEIYNSIFGPSTNNKDGALLLEQVEKEIWKLPANIKAPLFRAMKKNPLLLAVSSHTKLLLLENNSSAGLSVTPQQAAKRIALYWKRREELFGQQHVLMEGDLPEATLDDHKKYYTKSVAVVLDEDADVFEKALAKDFLQAVNLTMIESLTDALVNGKGPTGSNQNRLQILQQNKLIVRSDDGKWKVAGTTQFIMLFVVCEQFCPIRGAGRLMKYWSKKMELFTPLPDDTIADPLGITLKCPQMIESYDVLRRGFLRIMPQLDAHGRLVVVFSLQKCTQVLEEWKHEDIQQEGEKRIMKSIWYILHAAALHPQCQQNGLVFLANMRDCANTELLRRFQLRAACRDMLLRCLPLQVKSFHFFFPPSKTWWHSMIYAVFKHAEPFYKKHAVIHTGASTQDQELQELQELYGLHPSILPKELGGQVSMQSYQQWLKERKAQGL